MSSTAIPEIVIERLPLYLRTLNMLGEQGTTVTSSQVLGELLGLSPAQIRKDLSYFGEFGKQGTGYHIDFLRQQLLKILQVDRHWEVALVGVGDLGTALLRYKGFHGAGFSIRVVFDKDPTKIGRKVGGLQVLSPERLSEVIRERQIQLAIIAVTANEAQEVADELVEAGVRAILTYAPITLSLPKHVRVQYIDPVTGLQSMTYYLSPPEETSPTD